MQFTTASAALPSQLELPTNVCIEMSSRIGRLTILIEPPGCRELQAKYVKLSAKRCIGVDLKSVTVKHFRKGLAFHVKSKQYNEKGQQFGMPFSRHPANWYKL
jgi:hypothetical protein